MTPDNNKEHFKKSITVDGITKSVTIDQVENGYVVHINKYGQVGEDYFDESKTYISKDDPREKLMGDKTTEEAPASDSSVLGAIGNFLD